MPSWSDAGHTSESRSAYIDKHTSDLGDMLILDDHRATTPSRVLTKGFCDVGCVGHGLCHTYEELAQAVLEGFTVGDVILRTSKSVGQPCAERSDGYEIDEELDRRRWGAHSITSSARRRID